MEELANIKDFVLVVLFDQWLTLVGGCALMTVIGVVERVVRKDISWKWYARLLVVLLFCSVYLAWRAEHVRLNAIVGTQVVQRREIRARLGEFIEEGAKLRDRASQGENKKLSEECDDWQKRVSDYLSKNMEPATASSFKAWHIRGDGLEMAIRYQVAYLMELKKANEDPKP